MNKIRFYKYFFLGFEKPIIMEAESRDDADAMIVQLQHNSKVKIDFSKLIDLRIETPIIGVSKRKRQGKNYVWVGINNTADGWLLQEEFDNLTNNNKDGNKV